MFEKLRFLLLPLALIAETAPAETPFTGSSPDMTDGKVARPQFAPLAYSGPDENISPQIEWRGAPPDAKSFVVTTYDPDASTGSGWWHWAIADIPRSITVLPPGAGSTPGILPAGALQVNTDVGHPGYVGPLSPPGEIHRYVFTVTALNVVRMDLPTNATPALMNLMLKPHEVGKATFAATGSR